MRKMHRAKNRQQIQDKFVLTLIQLAPVGQNIKFSQIIRRGIRALSLEVCFRLFPRRSVAIWLGRQLVLAIQRIR